MSNKYLSRLKQEVKRAIKKAQGKRFVHFLHIGKTGGTAVKHALKQQLETRQYVIHLHPHRFNLQAIPEGEQVFFFLRDPISRFVSGFYSRQRQGQPRIFSQWNDDEKIAFEHFQSPNQLALSLSSSDPEEKARAEAAMNGISHVKNSYWQWFENEEYFKTRLADIFFVGFQEHLSADFEVLKAKLGLADYVTLPNDNLQAHRNPNHLDKRLDDAAIDNLRSWYRADYRFISLCKNLLTQETLIRREQDRAPLRAGAVS